MLRTILGCDPNSSPRPMAITAGLVNMKPFRDLGALVSDVVVGPAGGNLWRYIYWENYWQFTGTNTGGGSNFSGTIPCPAGNRFVLNWYQFTMSGHASSTFNSVSFLTCPGNLVALRQSATANINAGTYTKHVDRNIEIFGDFETDLGFFMHAANAVQTSMAMGGYFGKT